LKIYEIGKEPAAKPIPKAKPAVSFPYVSNSSAKSVFGPLEQKPGMETPFKSIQYAIKGIISKGCKAFLPGL
jgi:hypothetical protein